MGSLFGEQLAPGSISNSNLTVSRSRLYSYGNLFKESLQPKTRGQLRENLGRIFSQTRKEILKAKRVPAEEMKQFEVQLNYFRKFLEFCLLEGGKDRQQVFQFFCLKIEPASFDLMKTQVIKVLQAQIFLPELLSEWDLKLEKSKHLVLRGPLENEILGLTGVTEIVRRSIELWKIYYQNEKLKSDRANNLIRISQNIFQIVKDEVNALDLARMQRAHQMLEFNFEDFFVMKYVFFNILNQLQVNEDTAQR